MKYLLDTHAAVWAYEEDPRLPVRVRELMDAGVRSNFVIAHVTMIEIARLLYSGKLSFSKPSLQWLLDFVDVFKPQPLTVPIAWRSVSLDWAHRDPADRLICATALEHGLTLITCDRIITEWGGVPVLWE